MIESLGLDDNVAFLNQYLRQKDIIELLLATDIYVTPYLDPNQITSGTLSYALGAGKAVVSTPYLHAKEALADERGILVDFREPDQLSDGDQLDPRRPRPEGSTRAQRVRVRERVHVAEDRHAVPRGDARPRGVDAGEAPDPGAPRRVGRGADRRAAGREPADHARGRAPSQPGMEVISTINAGAARVGDEVVLLLRVAERPSAEGELPEGARLVDLAGDRPDARTAA